MSSSEFNNEIVIKEVVRAGDIMLFKYACPYCAAQQFSGAPVPPCSDCQRSLAEFLLNLKNSGKRVLVGSWRKPRHILKKHIKTLREIQSNQCAYCDQFLVDFHIDHILPLAGGGTNNLDNLVLACPPCNLLASSFIFNDFLAKKEFVIMRRKQRQAQVYGRLDR